MCYFDCKIHKKTPSQTMYICEFLLHIINEGREGFSVYI